MKKLLLLFVFTSFVTFAQTNPILNNNEVFNGDPMLMLSENNQIKGSKYILTEWSEGYLILNDSIFSYQNHILYDQLDGALILKAKDGSGFKVKDYSVTGFILGEIDSNDRYYFSKVTSSSFENQENKTKYYEVVNNSKKTNYLIKDTQKYIFDPNRSKGAGTNNNFAREYKEKTTYYIKTKTGKYVKSKLSKKAILKNLNDKNSELKAFLSSKKINFNKEHDVVKVLEYYHSLK
jgi:hypothetical protein